MKEMCVYLIQNSINNKKYIGQTRQGIKKRFYQHIYDSKTNRNNLYICKAIRKHGENNFNIWILEYCTTQEELNKTEAFYINYFKTLDKNLGYNTQPIDLNGNYKTDEITKKKISISSSRPDRKEHCRKLAILQRGIVKAGKYVGVCKNGKTYQAGISSSNNRIYIGKYYLEEEAAKAYDIAAIKYFGNDAILNFPELINDYISNKIIPISTKKSIYGLGKYSKIRGVNYIARDKQWRFILTGYKTTYFKTKEDAEVYATTFLKKIGYQ